MDESQEQSRGALGSDCHRKQLRQQKKILFYKSDGGRILEISKEVTGTLNCMKNQKDSPEERKRRAQLHQAPLWGSYHTVRKKIKQSSSHRQPNYRGVLQSSQVFNPVWHLAGPDID